MKLTKGTMITPRLRLVRPVGKGGMGSVWVAYHGTLKTEVAIKFIEGEANKNPKALGRFEREAEIAAKLKNPHVAQMFDHGTLNGGTPYIVMELLEGESLQERLKRGPLSLHETSLIVSQACQALGKAHKLGVIHRDVKPGNLFLIETDYELFVKLLDFGIAKAPVGQSDKELTKTGHLLGSPLYMSPEQFTAIKQVDHRADLWSIAVVAYRCLTSVPPFAGEALGNVIMAVMQRNFRPVTQLRPELPAALDGWFEKAFHIKPAQRFQSAKELAISFVEVVRGAAAPNEPRPRLPSITDMTQVAQDKGIQAESDKTVELPGAWHQAAQAPHRMTLKPNENAPQPEAEAATFAPAANTIDASESKGRTSVFAAAAVMLLVVAVGGFALLRGSEEETRKTPTAATGATATTTEPDVKPEAEPTEERSMTPKAASSAPEPQPTTSALASVTNQAPTSAPSTKENKARPTSNPTSPHSIARPKPTIPSDTGF